MKREEIDELLQRYSAAESRIAVNLHELQDHASYQLLKNGTLTGSTARKLDPVLAHADGLWSLFSSFRDTLSRARDLRGTDRKIDRDNEDELIRLLSQASVVVSTGTTPLHERDLLGSITSDSRITIEQALDTMRERYEPVRDAVASVRSVQRDLLPRLDAVATTISQAAEAAAALGITEPELGRAERRLEQLRHMALDDPLGIPPNEADKLEGLATVAAGRIAATHASRENLDADLASMAGLVAEIRTLRARAESARTETMKKIAAPDGLRAVPSPQAIDGPNGLASLAQKLLQGPASSWQARRVSLDKWMTAAKRLRSQLFRAEEANRAPLAARDELRGLYAAYRAKMAHVGKSEDATLFELADEIHNELYTRPTNIERARSLLGELGRAVR